MNTRQEHYEEPEGPDGPTEGLQANFLLAGRRSRAPMLSPAPTVSIRTLGTFPVPCDGVSVVPRTAWQSTKAHDLLKILIAQRGHIPRKQLIELLWPEVDPAVGGNWLSMLLSTVHNALQSQGSAGPLASDGTVVWLDRAQITVDVEEFLAHAKAALNAPRTE